MSMRGRLGPATRGCVEYVPCGRRMAVCAVGGHRACMPVHLKCFRVNEAEAGGGMPRRRRTQTSRWARRGSQSLPTMGRCRGPRQRPQLHATHGDPPPKLIFASATLKQAAVSCHGRWPEVELQAGTGDPGELKPGKQRIVLFSRGTRWASVQGAAPAKA